MPHSEATVSADGTTLRVVFPDGHTSSIDAAALWDACPSATARRARLDERIRPVPSPLRIVSTTAVGNYALNIAFSDGENRGVYPWRLLQDISARPSISDFIHAA